MVFIIIIYYIFFCSFVVFFCSEKKKTQGAGTRILSLPGRSLVPADRTQCPPGRRGDTARRRERLRAVSRRITTRVPAIVRRYLADMWPGWLRCGGRTERRLFRADANGRAASLVASRRLLSPLPSSRFPGREGGGGPRVVILPRAREPSGDRKHVSGRMRSSGGGGGGVDYLDPSANLISNLSHPFTPISSYRVSVLYIRLPHFVPFLSLPSFRSRIFPRFFSLRFCFFVI